MERNHNFIDDDDDDDNFIDVKKIVKYYRYIQMRSSKSGYDRKFNWNYQKQLEWNNLRFEFKLFAAKMYQHTINSVLNANIDQNRKIKSINIYISKLNALIRYENELILN